MFRRGIQHILMRTLGWLPAQLYGLVVRARHRLYDAGILPSQEGALPTLVLGNLTVGGTGKTPLTERLVLDLENILGKGSVGILSRGYGRDMSGFQWVTPQSTSAEAGDEPVMLARKLPHAAVAVCEDRLQGLERMRDERPELRWVVCDDAFQHRALKPTLSMLLIDSTQPIASDRLLPAGRLRDVPERALAADAIVVTRLDDVHGDLRATYAPAFPARKPIFGTHMETDPLLAWPGDVPCANGDEDASPDRRERILAVAGISRPERFMDRLAGRFQVVRREAFSDHQAFTANDFKRWKRIVDSDRLHALVTTEKDVVRMPLDGIEGVSIRYEPMHAEWQEPHELEPWLRAQIEGHPTDSAGTS